MANRFPLIVDSVNENIKELPSGDNLDLTGNDALFGDNDKAIFGAGSDLQIYHDGSHGRIYNNTGSLYIQASDDDRDIYFMSDDGSGGTAIYIAVDGSTGATSLRHYGDTKLATTSTGVTVTGVVTADGLLFGDNDKAIFGDSQNLEIYANGGFSYIDEVGANNLNIRTNGADIGIYDTANSQYMARFATGGNVRLFYDGGQKLATTSTGVDVTGEVTQDANILNAIDTSKDGVTAVDVFIYDTRKDSDGGAWRKRTQHTSWYNETLNTATRGSRREFPAVAVIVAETNKVTIYDGDDPDLPMWMVFNADTYCYIRGNDGVDKITALNGILVASANANGFSVVDFIADRNPVSVYGGVSSPLKIALPVSGRNNTTSSYRVASDYFAIVNTTVNDVAMTVLPNAPIDSATGLPIPTIAVATDGGVSVIKDDGTVVDGPDASNLESHFIDFTSNNEVFSGLYYELSPFNYSQAARYYIPSADKSSWATPRTIAYDYNGNGNVYPWPGTTQTWQLKALATSGNRDYLGSVQLLTIADVDEYDPQNNSMLAYITSSYNTGWMNGDIKLATLSDTDDTDVTGSELVTNGTFDTDLSGWSTVGSGTATHESGGIAKVTVSGDTQIYLYQAISVTAGKTYMVTATSNIGDTDTTSPWIRVGSTAGGTQYGSLKPFDNSIDSNRRSFTWYAPTTATAYVSFTNSNALNGRFFTLDDVSIQEVEEDRSVNGNGLQVFGTVTKNPVATGADLVAYGGFSNSNYLEQPYNSDLDYSGDFVVMGWYKGSGSGSVQTIFHRRTANGANNIGVEIGFNTDNTFYFYTHDGSSSTSTALTGNAVATGVWTHFACVRNGQRMTTYLNGKEYLTATGTVRDITSSTAVCRIGAYISSSPVYGWQGDAALIRTSATAPSPEQIAKIYEDEKFLYQENAGAVLYGSSDAVTALAYDGSTDLLHAGTSAGRSVFQGLRRIDNTTDAVGSAISASNGMVAED